MKKILRTALTLGLVWLGSCTDYGDDFDNLNQRIDALESQIAGFADLNSGVTALDGKVNALADVLATLPDNSDFGAGLANLQEQIEALQDAMAALDANDTDIQGQVDALNDALALLNDDMQELLNANNVYPGDLVIRTEGALDAALELVKDRETLIVNGALIIEPEGNATYSETTEGRDFSAVKVNKLTSKITAILGRTMDVSYIEDYDEDIIGEVGYVTVGGEIQDIDGDLDLSNLKTLNGYIEIQDIAGSVNLGSLTRHTALEWNAYTDDDGDYFDGDAEDVLENDCCPETDDVYESPLAYAGVIYMDDIDEDVNLSSLISAYGLILEDVEGETGIDLSSLISVDKDLMVSRVDADVQAPVLQEVGGAFLLDHGGNYSYPELVSVGEIYDYQYEEGYLPSSRGGSLVMIDNETEIVNFPKLQSVSGQIYVSSYLGYLGSAGDFDTFDYYYDENDNWVEEDATDNTFSAATSVTIFYKFSGNLESFDVPGECGFEKMTNRFGFSAPNATSVTVNGEYVEWADGNVLRDGELFVYAPKADVTLNIDDADSYNVAVNFSSLTASTLDNVRDLILVGNDTADSQTSVSLDALTAVRDDIRLYGFDELKLKEFDTEANEAYIYGQVNKLELKNISDSALKLAYLEELTVTALDNYFNFSDIALLCGIPNSTTPPADHDLVFLSSTLTTVSITGADCGASVELGSNDATMGYSTSFDAITSLTLGGTLNTAQVVGAEGLETLTTSGTITNWVDVDNTPTTRTIGHTPGDCSVE